MRRRLGIAAALGALAWQGAGGISAGGERPRAAPDLPPVARSAAAVTEPGPRPAHGVRPEAPAAAAAAFPERARIGAVRRFLAGRRGSVGWALVDSRGRLHGSAARRVYPTASVVKAMLLVAYLRQIGDRAPDAAERALLRPMITISSNRAADEIQRRVGNGSLNALARRAGMTGFRLPGHWARAQASAADQARFFARIDRLVPHPSRAYLRELLSPTVPRQRWGVAHHALSAGFETFVKGGWRPTASGRLLHEAALFERGRTRLSIAVLSDGNPSHRYAIATLRGVARRVFHEEGARAGVRAAANAPGEAGTRAHRRAGLVDARRFAPGIRVELAYRTRDNLTGGPLPGYCEDWALLHRPAAFSLGQVQRYLRRRGLGLLVLDAYRPLRATGALVRWAERTGRGHLVGSYIARRSRHNTGSAVDLTLVRARDGKRLRMGRFDDLGPRAHTLNATGRTLRNRLMLKRAMERFGFEGYWREWWHFEHHVRPERHLDLTLGCGRHN